MKKGKIENPKQNVTRSISINVNAGNATEDTKLPSVDVQKMVKLGPADASTIGNVTEFLPELGFAEEIQDLEAESQQVQKQVDSNENEESFIENLSQGELNKHVQICLEMSSENKINQKNAFALQLIDCLSLFIKENKDFSAMACTLDAGAKIYACRVDALHQQVMRLADQIILNNKEKRTAREDNEGETNTEKGLKKEQKKSRKNNFILPSETLKRQIKQVDPKDKYLRFEALPGAILSGVRRDPNDLSLSLECYSQFWQNWETYKPLKAKGKVCLPDVKIIRSKSQKENTEESSSPIEKNQSNGIIEQSIGSDAGLDYEEIPVFNEVNDASPDMSLSQPQSNNDGDHCSTTEETGYDRGLSRKCDGGEVEVVATAMNRLRVEAEADGARIPTRLEALKMIFEQASEYDYLKLKNSNYWAGPDFWKRPRGCVVTDAGKSKVPNKKKIPTEIVYTAKTFSEKVQILNKKISSLSKNTITNWEKNKKTTLPIDVKVESSWFSNLFHIERCREASEVTTTNTIKNLSTEFVDVLENLEETGEISDISKNPLSLDQENTSGSQDSVNAAFYERFSGTSTTSNSVDPLNSAFYSTGFSNKELGKIIKVQVSSSSSSGFDESALVPVPKMVKFEPIKYSTRPIRVDMQHLKSAMMEVILEELESDEMEKKLKSEFVDGGDGFKPQVKFRDILKRLPMRLERRTREDLSTAIAFTAILSLTNENSLELEKCEDGDFFVRLPDYSTLADEKSSSYQIFGKYN